MKQVAHFPIDRTPRNNPNRQRDNRAPFTEENCSGYSADEMAALNAEFWERWNNSGEWTGFAWTFDDARRAFQDEVARR